jgi:uncharacterized protein YegP (UPF0339 family)
LKASNGETILVSERYYTKADCKDGIASVKTNSAYDFRFIRLVSGNRKYYFTLKAGNGEVIGTSEMYNTEESRDDGIAAVKLNGPHATVDDQTIN